MLEEKELKELDTKQGSVDQSESVLTLDKPNYYDIIKTETDAILKAIADTETNDTEALKANIELFNNNSIKQAIVQEEINTKIKQRVSEQIYKNITEHPEYYSAKDYTDIYKAISDISDKNKNQINKINEQPLIQINSQKNNLTVNMFDQDLTRDQQENVKDVITQLLNSIQNNNSSIEDIIDVQVDK